MIRSRLAAALLACFCGVTLGQPAGQSGTTVQISGRVVDPIGGGVSASLMLASGSGEAIAVFSSAQASGAFTFDAVPRGRYTLLANAAGFRTTILAVDARTEEDVTIGTVVLEVGWLEGDPLGFLQYLLEPRSTPTDPTVCEVLKNPARFHGKVVRVRASASGVGIDTPPHLYDGGCPGMILLWFPTSGSILNDWSYRTFKSDLGSIGAIEATIEGKLEYQLMISEPNAVSLTVTNVSDVIAAPRIPQATSKP